LYPTGENTSAPVGRKKATKTVPKVVPPTGIVREPGLVAHVGTEGVDPPGHNSETVRLQFKDAIRGKKLFRETQNVLER